MTLKLEWITMFEVDRPTIFINCEEVGPRDGKNHAAVSYEFYRVNVHSVHTMFERVNSNPWKQVDLVARAEEYGTINHETPVRGSTDSPERDRYDKYIEHLRTRGTFYTPLLDPGDVYEVRIFDDSTMPFDPNIHGDKQYLIKLDVFALCSKPAEGALYGQSGLEIGGTYCFANVSALVPVFMKVWIGETPPVVHPDGTQELPSPTASRSLLDFKSDHQHEFQPLLPGTPYHILLRLSDKKGRWQFIALTGTTKQRMATISFKAIHMIDDSDDIPFPLADPANAYYQFKIEESGHVAFSERYPDIGELNLESGDPAHNLPPRLSKSFGPKRILRGQEQILVAVHGWDVDRFKTPPWLWPFGGITVHTSHDEASSGTFGLNEYQPLSIPTGRFRETVIDTVNILGAEPDDTTVDASDLRFNVNLSYSITYV